MWCPAAAGRNISSGDVKIDRLTDWDTKRELRKASGIDFDLMSYCHKTIEKVLDAFVKQIGKEPGLKERIKGAHVRPKAKYVKPKKKAKEV